MGSDVRVGVGIQMRSGSSRLPGKCLYNLVGESDSVERMADIVWLSHVGPLLFLIPEGDETLKHRIGGVYPYLEGPTNNVLERYMRAFYWLNVDHMVRLTGDCVLHNPDLIRMMVHTHLAEGNDFTTNAAEPYRWADGLDCEIFSHKFLNQLHFDAENENNKQWQEHVTLGAYGRWNEYHDQGYVLDRIEWTLPIGEKWSLDTEEDLERIRRYMAGTSRDEPEPDVLDLLEE